MLQKAQIHKPVACEVRMLWMLNGTRDASLDLGELKRLVLVLLQQGCVS